MISEYWITKDVDRSVCGFNMTYFPELPTKTENKHKKSLKYSAWSGLRT